MFSLDAIFAILILITAISLLALTNHNFEYQEKSFSTAKQIAEDAAFRGLYLGLDEVKVATGNQVYCKYIYVLEPNQKTLALPEKKIYCGGNQ